MKRILVIMLALAVISLIIGGCSQSAAPAPAPGKSSAPASTSTSAKITPPAGGWPKLTFNTAPSGTNPHTIGVAWSTLAGKYLPGMEIAVEPAVGAPQAVIGFLQGHGDITYDASNIVGAEISKYLGGKTLAAGPQHLITAVASAVHIVAKADSGINTVADFKGKKILGKVATGGGVDLARQALFRAYGFTDNDVILLTGNNGSHLADQLKEGVGDAGMFFLGLRDPSIIDLCTTKNVRWIPVPKEKAGPVVDEVWMTTGIIPAGTYPKQDQDVPSIQSPGSFDVRPTMSEDLAYALTQLYFEHWDEFTKMAPWAKEYNLKGTLNTAYLPFHPGAVKYYKEKGIWTAEAEARQQQLLNKVIPMPASAPPVAK